MNGEFMCLYAMMDVLRRCVLGWRPSIILSVVNVCELMAECIRRHGKYEIVNINQGV